jgi:hypothetical protein
VDTRHPLYCRADEHRTDLCARKPDPSNAMVRHLIDQPVATRNTSHGWSGPFVVYRDTVETKLKVAEALLVLSLPRTATANTAIDFDEATHPSRRTMNIHRGWITAAARWLHNWPTLIFTEQRLAQARLIERVKKDDDRMTRLPSFASTAIAADTSILLDTDTTFRELDKAAEIDADDCLNEDDVDNDNDDH